ncbi:uncharacterized protein LOC133792441 [Humulus lupulus]|uniref:uncharacterized protein LOC133792441 n=1 Tax=Humulus lupulus TaxID=3486 RepID=UPI002B402FF4|nr:uncharacterized protein LOC133792441 [Humulus lupulus]
MCARAEELANMCTEENDVKELVTVDNLQMVGLLPSNQNMTVESTTEEANAIDQSNTDTEVVTDQFSPRPSLHSPRLDSEMFRQFNTSLAPKRKSGEGSGSTPPSKVPRTTPPSQGRQPKESITIPQLTPSLLPPSASLTPTRLTGLSEALRTTGNIGKELLNQTLRDASTIQSFESLPRLSVEVVLQRGLAQLMNVTKVETLTSSERDLRSKVEQAEKTVAERDESLRGLADKNQKQTQINKSLTDQLEKLTRENEELTRESEELK